MSDVLKEVLSDQSDEKKLHYFKKILPVIIIFTILVILIMIINNWYNDIETKNNQKTGDILLKSISSINDNKELTLESLENLASTSNNKTKEIALLQQVGIKITNEDYKGAKTLLENIIHHSDYRDLTIAYARLMWLSLVIDEPNLSNDEKKQIQKYLEYFDNENQVFFGTASIIKALWYIKNDSIELAKNILYRIIALEHIQGIIKEQARTLLSNLAQQ